MDFGRGLSGLEADLPTQCRLVQDLEPTALDADEPAQLEVGKRLVHALAGRSDRRGHVVLSEGDAIQSLQLDQVPRDKYQRIPLMMVFVLRPAKPNHRLVRVAAAWRPRVAATASAPETERNRLDR